MSRKVMGALAAGALGVAAYAGVAVSTGVAQATPSIGITNPSWSPVIGHFPAGIDPRAMTDVDPGPARSFWQVSLLAKGATDVQVIENIVAPGGTFGWHGHPGPSLIIVKSGTLSVYHPNNCTHAELYGPGQALGATLVDQGNDVHLVRNETAGVDDVYVVAFLPTGASRRIDKPNPDPAVCPH
jgi:quercetin dioxygenase-like cupin family protein